MSVGCPSAEHLQAFLSGRLAVEDIDAVAVHLETCNRCEATLAQLSPDDELAVALATSTEADRFAEEPECVQVLARIADESLADATLLYPGQEKADVSDVAETGAPVVIRETPAVRFGQYILLRQIGRGGMGAVYQALHTRLERVVAIKMLVSDRMQDAEAVARFQREMRAVGRLEHPHIVRAMDAGEQDGVHYLVMEYVNGPDVAALVNDHGQLPVADACEIARQVAQGLDYAFRRGLVHRDIKPSNVMISVGDLSTNPDLPPVDEPAIVRVLDFGLALLEDNRGVAVTGAAEPSSNDELTSAGQLMGTLDYIAPEQVGSSHDVDVRADLYSLGATLFKMLTGSSPHAVMKAEDIGARIDAIFKHDLPSIETLRPGLPPSLINIVNKMLARAPQARFQTPMDVVTALSEFTHGADLKALALASWQHPPIAPSLRSAPSVLAKMQDLRDSTVPFLPGSETAPLEPTTDRQRAAETGADIRLIAKPQTAAATIGPAGGVNVPHEKPRTNIMMLLALPVVVGLALAAYVFTRPQTPLLEQPRESVALAPGSITDKPDPKSESEEFSEITDANSSDAINPAIAEQLAKDVVAELKRLNPDFKEKFEFEADEGRVVGFQFEAVGVTDLTPLRRFQHLRRLRFRMRETSDWSLPLRDLSPLKGMQLEQIGISGTQVEDLSPLVGMPLTSLSLRQTPVRNLEVLKDAPLEHLDVLNSAAVDPSTLKLFPLRTLFATVNDLSPLRGLPLIRFQSNGTAINDLSPLVDMPLEVLEIGHSAVPDLHPLQEIQSLRRLVVRIPPAQEATVTALLPQLQVLNQRLIPQGEAPRREMSDGLHPLDPRPRWPFDPDDGVTYVWSVPENLGVPVNSDAVDLLWGISDDERTIYIRRLKQLITMQRSSRNEPFGTPVSDDRLVMGENWGGVTSDGLLAYSCTKGGLKQNELWLARRASIQDSFGPRTMGNTDDSEGSRNSPAISPDGLTLLIGKLAAGTASSDLCLFSRSNLDAPFSKGQLIPSPVSTPDWDMAYYVSNDRRFVIASTQRRGTSSAIRRMRYFWRASADDKFQTAMTLGIPLGSAEDSDANGAFRLANGGRAIYFTASAAMGGHGAEDIWLSRREPLTEPVYLDDLPEVEYYAHLDDTSPFPSGKKFGTHGLRHDAEPFLLKERRPQHSVMLHPLINETAYVSYDLDRQYAVFEGLVGLGDNDREVDVFAPITFRILGDGQELWTSRPLTVDGASQEFGVVVENVKKLRLEVLCPGSNDFAHACWIEPRLRRRPNAPPLRAQTASLELKSSEWTDVTTAIRPALHSNGGHWEVRDHALHLTGDTPSNNPRISLPVEITESYELKLKATRTSDSGLIAIHLPVGKRHCVASFDTAWPGHAERIVGLQFLRQMRAFTEGNPTRAISEWETNRTYELHFIVELLNAEEARIQVAKDGQVLIDWTGLMSDLGADPRWYRPSPGIGSNTEVQARFENIQLKRR